MGLLDFIFKKKEIEQISDLPETEIKNELFNCHYCHTSFEVDKSKLFPVSVPSCDGQYYYQGIGIQCPDCKKTCIYG